MGKDLICRVEGVRLKVTAALPVPVVGNQFKPLWPQPLLFPQMLHQLRFFGCRYSRNAALLLKAVPGSDKVDSKMSQLTDGSLVVVVILDVQVAAARQGKKGDFGRSWQNFALRQLCNRREEMRDRESWTEPEKKIGDRIEKRLEAPRTA